MSTPGRGRGYTGRHHLREPRPGDTEILVDLEAARTLSELSPRSTNISEFEQPNNEFIKNEVNSNHLNPDKLSKTMNEPVCVSADDEAVMQDLLKVDEQFAPLLTLLEQFSPGEDGIVFNRKLRNFESTINNMCPDEVKLHQAFSSFRAAALMNSVTARKLATVGASFTRQQRQQLLRRALLDIVMQGTFSKLDVLERSNPTYLINAANLIGEYFAEARLSNGNKVHILASPLLTYMKALLNSDDIKAHRSLATQLMLNGRELMSVLAQDLDELSISIRLRLLVPPPGSIIWLLLSADLCLNKFLPLPNSLQDFYASHLDLKADDSYSEVNYGSWKKSPDKDEFSKSDASIESVDKTSHNLSQISLNNEDGETKPKLRPILGAGAGSLRHEHSISVSQDNFDTWAPKSSLGKRYDLNSWRQNEEETLQNEEQELVFNPSILPPNLQPTYQITVPNYPPPSLSNFNNYSQDPNYLQQGDGTYIQSPFQNNPNFTPQGDGFPQLPYQNTTNYQTQNEQFITKYPQTETAGEATQELINNEITKTNRQRPAPVENWRKEKSDIKDESNKNRPKNWNRQRSKESVNDEDTKEKNGKDSDSVRSSSRNSREIRSGSKMNRRNSSDTESSQSNKPRRHVTDVPRSQKYWDHDDRCDKDYNS